MNDPEGRVQLLLDELCTKLGFCLTPAVQSELRCSNPSDVDSFTNTVMAAQGMDPRLNKQLRRVVRDTIDWHMRRWD